jgi:hypothetical protein
LEEKGSSQLTATKNMRLLLLILCYLLTYPALAQVVKPRVFRISNTSLFERLMSGLDANQLFRTYRTDLKLFRVTRNRHEPAVRDSLLQVKTPTDKLVLFKNRYKTLLRAATITSTRVSFAGLRVGVTQKAFCQALHLKPNYDQYVFTDGTENFVQLMLTFSSGKLWRVEYKELIDMDAID